MTKIVNGEVVRDEEAGGGGGGGGGGGDGSQAGGVMDMLTAPMTVFGFTLPRYGFAGIALVLYMLVGPLALFLFLGALVASNILGNQESVANGTGGGVVRSTGSGSSAAGKAHQARRSGPNIRGIGDLPKPVRSG